MTDIAQLQREHFPGRTYEDIARADGPIPPQLAERRNPPQSHTDIPFARYITRTFHEAEAEKVWGRTWQYACREEHIPETGDYFVYDIGRRSLIIVRTEDGGLRAYPNSCLHRGTKLKPSGTCGWSKAITCPFHGWSWNLDGTVANIPCRWEFPHKTDADLALPQARVSSWNGFVFVNFAAAGPDLATYLEVLPAHFRDWDMSGWYVHTHVRKHLPGNWKIAIEAFMEAYHTPVAHPEMTHVVSDHNMQHDILSGHITRDLCAMASPSPTSTLRQTEQELLDKMLMGDASMAGEKPLVPEGRTARWAMAEQLRRQMAESYSLDYSARSVPEMIDSLKYFVFPNIFIYPSVGLPLLQQFRPDGDDHDRAIFDQLVFHPKPADGSTPEPAEVVVIGEDESFTSVPGMDPFLASVLDQDTDIMRWQREGMYASAKGAETLSIYQEARIRHLHDTIDRYLEG